MQGGTFSITNGGVFGSLMSTPILNAPQSGILGMHKIQPRPMAIDGKVEIRPMMYLALSYDHRLVDGREAVTFLVRGQGRPGRPAAAAAGCLNRAVYPPRRKECQRRNHRAGNHIHQMIALERHAANIQTQKILKLPKPANRRRLPRWRG